MEKTYVTIINGINDELTTVKNECDALKAEKQYSLSALEKPRAQISHEQVEESIGILTFSC